ncbi:hypothetical protein [Streptomyces mirabilis]|uniref:hypothetical protein n=1 Tax=Streptomyces mirabilis TaxID=68239 RepID=UPI0036D9E889
MVETPIEAAMVERFGTLNTDAASIVAAGINQVGSPNDFEEIAERFAPRNRSASV